MRRRCGDLVARLFASLGCEWLGRLAGIKLKPKKCEVILIGARRDAAAESEVRTIFERIGGDWRDFRIARSGKCLGVYLGPEAGERRW